MLIVGQVSERNIGQLRVGMAATARVVTGETVTGKIRFISPVADASTRTFHIEIDGTDVTGPINFNTGGAGWQVWQDVTIDNIALNSGVQELRIVMDSSSFNINYLEAITSE